jgi:hypothetical protein
VNIALLLASASQLPAPVRFLVTSRPDWRRIKPAEELPQITLDLIQDEAEPLQMPTGTFLNS